MGGNDYLTSAIKGIWGGRKSNLQLQLIFVCYSTKGKADIIISGSPK